MRVTALPCPYSDPDWPLCPNCDIELDLTALTPEDVDRTRHTFNCALCDHEQQLSFADAKDAT